MIATDGKRRDAGVDDDAEMALDILVRGLQAITAAEGNVADVGDAKVEDGRGFQCVVVRADALDSPHGAGAEAGAVAVGDAEVHRDADRGHLQVAEIRALPVDGADRRSHEGRNAGIGRDACAARVEDLVGDPLELRVTDGVAAAVAGVLFAKALQVFGEVHKPTYIGVCRFHLILSSRTMRSTSPGPINTAAREMSARD